MCIRDSPREDQAGQHLNAGTPEDARDDPQVMTDGQPPTHNGSHPEQVDDDDDLVEQLHGAQGSCHPTV